MTQPTGRHPLPVPPQRDDDSSVPDPRPRYRALTRAGLGLLGVVLIPGALWLTLIILFVVGLGLDPSCNEEADATLIPWVGAGAAAVGLIWTAVSSIWLLAIRQRSVARRRWIDAPPIIGALGLAVAAAITLFADYGVNIPPGGCLPLH